jgi:DNA-binding response OmpR family regulator
MRILIINSHSKRRSRLQQVLQQMCFAVDSTVDCTKGKTLAKLNRYDLVIVAHKAPPEGAHAFCEDVRSDGHTYPILVFMSEHDPEAGTACLDAGADDFTKTPFTLTEFVARVRSLLRRPKTVQTEEITIGPIKVDRKKLRVTKGRTEVRLTRKQYAILDYLALNRGSVIPQDELIDHVWGDSADLFSAGALKSHIYCLRKKLGDRKQDIIETIIERGYRVN